MKGLIASCLLAAICLAGDALAQSAATVDLTVGSVAIRSANGNRQPGAKGASLSPGDTIETGADGELHAVLADGGYLAVRPNTVVKIAAFSAKGDASDNTWIDLVRGALRAVTGWIPKTNPRAYRITTAAATIGVRGTDFEVVHVTEGPAGPEELTGTYDWVHAGTTFLKTRNGQMEVAPGRAAYAVSANETPRLYQGIPEFLRKRQGRFEDRIERHARDINEHMAQSLKERGLLKKGESVEEYIEHRQTEQRSEETQHERAERRDRERAERRTRTKRY